MPRPRQMNVDDCAQPGWPIGERDQPIGEEERDEQIGAAVLFEQAQEKLLHQAARNPKDVIFVNPEDGTPESFIRTQAP
jgi:hypothetical protein